MKVLKKVKFAMLAFIMVITVVAFGIMFGEQKPAIAADSTDVSHYFYEQLTDEQKEFYKAMEEMDSEGIFIAGGDYDLVESNHVTRAQLEAYANGDSRIIKDMGAARDAFYTDYADIFYVDFGYISLRVTLDTEGTYHAYLGAGRADSYYTKGFSNSQEIKEAIKKYEAVRDDVVEQARAAQPTEAQIEAYGEEMATTVARIQYAHKWIAENTIYKLEEKCTPGNEGHVRTPYGVFVAKHDDGTQNKFLDNNQGEALCEGYSRAFKVLMDKLGVPCVLVNGVYRHAEDKEELHMWCHVQLNGEWYAVDQTFDDINRRSAATGVLLTGLGDAYTEDYFLKGYSFMNTQHATSAYKSEAEYAFTYPQLAYSNLGSEISTEHGAMIWVAQDPYDANLGSTNIKVSVFVEEKDEYGVGTGYGEWCSYAQAAKKGVYLVVRYEGNYLPEQIMRAGGDLSDPKYENDKSLQNASLAWAYVNPIPGMYGDNIVDYDNGGPEGGGYTIMRNTSKPLGFEFAVTTVAPRPHDPYETDLDKIAEMFTFLGDPTILVGRSGFMKLLYGDATYNPPPFIVKATPSSWGKLSIGKGPYNIEVEYDQYLKLPEGEKLQMSVVGMRATGEFVKGTNAVVLEKVVDLSTVKWDRGEGDNTHFVRGGRISFKFIPSPEYAHDNVMYYFNFNLVGENSGKQVNPVEYCAGYESDACCYKANGFHWSVYAQPQLVESGDLSTEGWKTSDGTDLSETKSRLALVVTSPSKKQNAQMNDLIGDELGMEQGDVEDGGFESFTYNISLTICKGVSIETGQGVRIGIGFPEGFTYDDSMNGVSFMAYHFIRDAQNNVVEVEELEVTVTPLGLIILVKSFSPFAIVVKKSDDTQPVTEKSVVIMNSDGGTAYAEGSNMFKLKEGETRTVTVKAHDGYVIESVKAGGSPIDVKNKKELQFEVAFANIANNQQIVEVNFVPESVKAAEEQKGLTTVIQQLRKAVINCDATVSSIIGKTLRIAPDITAYGNANTYQWYKDGVALAGQTGAVLVIENATEDDAGTYTLVVTSYSGSEQKVSESSEIKVTMTEDLGGNPGGNPGDTPAVSNLAVIFGIVGGAIVVIAGIAVLAFVIIKSKKRG